MHSKKGSLMIKTQSDRSVSKQRIGEMMMYKLLRCHESIDLMLRLLVTFQAWDAAETERWYAGGPRSVTVKRSSKKLTSINCR